MCSHLAAMKPTGITIGTGWGVVRDVAALVIDAAAVDRVIQLDGKFELCKADVKQIVQESSVGAKSTTACTISKPVKKAQTSTDAEAASSSAYKAERVVYHLFA